MYIYKYSLTIQNFCIIFTTMTKHSVYNNLKIVLEQSIEEITKDAYRYDKPTIINLIKSNLLRFFSMSPTKRHRTILNIKKIREKGL